MPNLFQRMGAAIGRAFGREGQALTPGPQPEREERRGLGRILDRITGADRRRELEAREREVAERERLEREARERAIERERQVAERERQLQELRDRLAAKEERTIPRWLAGIPPVMPLGPKARDGVAYTTMDSDDVMVRLQEAANLGKRVSLRIHDGTGWHDLFINPSGPGRHQAARGMSADYLIGQIGADFDQWVEDGCDTDAGGGYEDELGEADGYQLTVWS